MQAERISTRARPWSEPAATVIWETLYQLGIAERTILWNQFAFHPYKSEATPHTNRTPTPAERERGLPLLEHFLSLYPQVPIIAVGRAKPKAVWRLWVCVLIRRFAIPRWGAKGHFRQDYDSEGQTRDCLCVVKKCETTSPTNRTATPIERGRGCQYWSSA